MKINPLNCSFHYVNGRPSNTSPLETRAEDSKSEMVRTTADILRAYLTWSLDHIV